MNDKQKYFILGAASMMAIAVIGVTLGWMV